MSKAVVLYCHGSPLLLIDIKRDANGRIKEGWVVNGAWQYERLANTAAAKENITGFVVNQWHQTIDDELEVPVVGSFRFEEYNEVIASANESRNKYLNETKTH